MNNTAYQVYFINGNGKREYLNENFYLESEAQDAVEKFIDKGFENATYEGFTFSIEDFPE